MMKRNIEIIEARQQHRKIVAGFQIKMAAETEGIELDKQIVNKGVQQVFNDPAKGKYYLGLNDDEVVASMLTTPEWSDWRNGKVLWLQSVYVLPEYRKQGIFRLMYNHIRKIVIDNADLVGIRLYVDRSNINAQKVYESLGMNGEHYKIYEWMP